MKRIPLAGPSITEKEIAYVTDAVTNAWFEDANCFHQRFEATFSRFINSSYCLALPSCTSAIHLSLLSLGIGPGDEVIVPDVTWIASSAPISYVGATPVFADIDPDTWCLSAQTIEPLISSRTRAIIVVDLYGNMPDYCSIQALARQHGLAIIEDAAEAFGSTLGQQRAGTFGTTGVFSFHGSKTMTSGEGGMLITDDEAIYQRSRFLADHGRLPGDTRFLNTEVAYKYKMSSMQAALGLAQVERAEELIRKKRQIFNWYDEGLNALEGLQLNSEIPNGENSYWMVTAILDSRYNMSKFSLIEQLSDYNIDSRPFFSPLSSLDAYTDYPDSQRARTENTHSYLISQSGINLPSSLSLQKEDVEYVIHALKKIIAAA